MPDLQNLDREIHRNLRVDEEAAFAAGRDTSMCLVALNEIMRLALEYPLVLMRPGNTGPLVCVALFGVEPTENLYWRDGRWSAEFLPLNIARQPFSVDMPAVAATMATAGENPRQFITRIDLQNPGVQEVHGKRLFDDDGKQTPYLQYKLGLLTELVEGELQSGRFVARLVELELVRPIYLDLKAPGIEPRRITGLHSIDESKLRALDAGTVAALNANGYLLAMHAMLTSLGHLQILARRSARRREAAKEKAPSLS